MTDLFAPVNQSFAPTRSVKTVLSALVRACLMLALLVIAQQARATGYTWTGAAGTLWSNSANWSPAGVPANGDTLIFPASAGSKSNSNDIAGLSLGGLTFSGNGYTLDGNGIILSGPYATNTGNVINFAIDVRAANVQLSYDRFNGSVDINAGGASFSYTTLNGGVNVHANAVRMSNVVLNGNLSGSGTIDGDRINFNSTGTYSGLIRVDYGYLNNVNLPSASFGSFSYIYGNGTVGAFTASGVYHADQVYSNVGLEYPGSVGQLNTGNLLLSGTTRFQINGTTPGTGYSQINVTGSVTLTNATLELFLDPNFAPSLGQQYVLITNDGSDAVTGTFAGLAEGAVITVNNQYQFTLSYHGGTGNDVVLTCTLVAKVWTGAAGNLWSQAGNWTGGVPVNGDALYFPPGAANITMVNDLNGLSIAGLSIGANASSYVISGNAITLAGPFLSQGAIFGNTLNLPIDIRASGVTIDGVVLGGNIDVNATGVQFSFATINGPLNIHANAVTLYGVSVNGALAGTGAIDSLTTYRGAGAYSGTISGTVRLDGASLPSAIISAGITGNGTVGAANVSYLQTGTYDQNGALVSNSTGLINTGNLSFQNGEFIALIKGSTAGAEYSQVNVAGTVNLSGATLILSMDPSFVPAFGQQFVLINNDGADPVSGQFLIHGAVGQWTEGSIFNLGGYQFSLSYRGGDGNDVVVTAGGNAVPTVTVGSSANPSLSGQQVIFTATVTGSGPVPTGTVTFFDSGVTIGQAPVVSGVATFAYSFSGAGSHNIAAQYSGDIRYQQYGGFLSSPQQVTNSTLTIAPSTLPGGSLNAAYATTTLIASGGTAPYTFSVSGGALPTGLNLSPAGVLSGTPTQSGAFAFSVNAVDTNHLSGARSYSIQISAPSLQSQSITFSNPGTQLRGGSLTLTATASSGLAVSFTSLTGSVCTVAGAVASFAAAGTCTIAADQAGNASYQPAARVTQSFTVSSAQQAQTIAFSNPGVQSVGNHLTLTASATSALPVSFSSLTTSVCTVSANQATFVAAGTCTVAADQSGNASYSAAPRVTQSFAVNPVVQLQSQTISFANPGTQNIGRNLNLSASASSGLPVNFSSLTTGICNLSNGQAVFTSVGTCTLAADQGGNTTFAAAPRVTQSFTVNPALQSQTITFANPGTRTSGQNLTLTGIATSGLSVTFSSQTNSVCTVSGTVATFISAGTCTIAADQAGNSTYAAATRVTQSFTVNAATAQQQQGIYFANPGTVYVGKTASLSALASSGLAVTVTSSTPSVCTVSGMTVSALASGTCFLTASQAGNVAYLAAPSVVQSFAVIVVLNSQLINFPNPGTQLPNRSITLGAVATSGLTVFYTSQTTSVCTVSGSVATLLLGGTCTVTASQAGNASYISASSVTQSFGIVASGSSQTINFPNPGPKGVGTSTPLSATATTGLTVTFTSLTPAVCYANVTVLNTLSAGTCTVAADQAGNTLILAAPRVTQSFTVSPAAPAAPFMTSTSCYSEARQITCGFTSASNNGSPITGFTVFCAPTAGGQAVSANGAAAPITVTGLAAGTAYTCWSAATNAIGTSAISNKVAGGTPSSVAVLPAAPSINQAIAGNGKASVYFTGSPSDGGRLVSSYVAVSYPGGIVGLCAAPCNTILVTGLTNGTVYTFTVRAQNAIGQSPISNTSNAVTPLATLPTGAPAIPWAQRSGNIDIDGSGRSQILLRSPTTGQFMIGRYVGTKFQFTAGPQIATNYRFVGVGDFTGNGKSDLVFQDISQQTFGDVYIYPDFAGAVSQFVRTVKLPWLAEAVADFDGDGYSDIAFRFTGDDGIPNDTGVSYIWFMNGSNVSQVRKRGGAPLSWTLLGAADFNGDGAADLVYVSPTNDVRILMATASRTCANVAAWTAPSDARLLKVADFTGNGKGDIFYNFADGTNQLMSINTTPLMLPASTNNPDDANASCTSTSIAPNLTQSGIFSVDPTWKFYASGDFNGDGITDMVWMKPDGTLVLYAMPLGPNNTNAGTAPAGYDVVQP